LVLYHLRSLLDICDLSIRLISFQSIDVVPDLIQEIFGLRHASLMIARVSDSNGLLILCGGGRPTISAFVIADALTTRDHTSSNWVRTILDKAVYYILR
jgi:hypothetical protein